MRNWIKLWMMTPAKRQNFFILLKCSREETHEQAAEEEEGEDLVVKAEAEFFKIIEAEKKALEDAENKRNVALAEMKRAIAQEEVTHNDYKEEGEEKDKMQDQVKTIIEVCSLM